MPMTRCEEVSKIIKKMIGWNFAEMITQQFPILKITLVKAGPAKKDLTLSVDRFWVEKNNTCDIVLNKDEVDDVKKHLKECQSSRCLATKKIWEKIEFDTLGYLVGSLCPVVISLNFKTPVELTFSRKTIPGGIFNRLILIFSLFSGENKNLWIWPNKETRTITK